MASRPAAEPRKITTKKRGARGRVKQPVTPILEDAILAIEAYIPPIKRAGPERMAELLRDRSPKYGYGLPVPESTKALRAIQLDLYHLSNRVKDAGLE